MGYVVMVDDNSHFMDESSRYRLGDFADADTAIGHCRRIVDEYLASAHTLGMTADALYDNYVMFGEYPYVCCADVPAVGSSALDYAQERSSALCAAP